MYIFCWDNNLEWVFCLMICFCCMISILFVLIMVDKWWVIIMLVWFLVIFCKVFRMVCLDWLFNDEVVLLNIMIVGCFNIVWVMVICCFLLLDSFKLCLLICVFKLLGRLVINCLRWVRWIVCWIFCFVVLGWL